MEIVSKPDMRSADEAAAYLTKLRSIVRYLGTCDGNMDEGSMRCDVNVSVRKPGGELGTRCEIKNVNSIRFVEAGDRVRGAPPGRDHRGRRQDRAGDPPVRSGQGRDALDALQGGGARLPLLPRSRPAAAGARPRSSSTASRPACPSCPTPRRRASSRTTASRAYDAGVLVAEKETAEFFETVAKGRDAKEAVNWSPATSSPC